MRSGFAREPREQEFVKIQKHNLNFSTANFFKNFMTVKFLNEIFPSLFELETNQPIYGHVLYFTNSTLQHAYSQKSVNRLNM